MNYSCCHLHYSYLRYHFTHAVTKLVVIAVAMTVEIVVVCADGVIGTCCTYLGFHKSVNRIHKRGKTSVCKQFAETEFTQQAQTCNQRNAGQCTRLHVEPNFHYC